MTTCVARMASQRGAAGDRCNRLTSKWSRRALARERARLIWRVRLPKNQRLLTTCRRIHSASSSSDEVPSATDRISATTSASVATSS
jgi:hypothetical protein